MQYYKKGDGNNAHLIQKAFEAKGYTTNSGIGFDPNIIYFTVKGYKAVQRCAINSIPAILLEELKEVYQELCIPKFKVGDVLQDTRFSPKFSPMTVYDIDFEKENYIFLGKGVEVHIAFSSIHKFCDYYDKKETTLPFEAGDLVLVRNSDTVEWKLDIFSHVRDSDYYKFSCTGGYYKYCIPFKGNKQLVGTLQKCCKQYPPICYGKT